MADLNPYQVEAYRYVMYEQERERREFWCGVISEVVEKSSLALANLIVAKMALALAGEEFLDLGNRESAVASETTSIREALKPYGGLTEEDIAALREAGVRLDELSTINGELL